MNEAREDEIKAAFRAASLGGLGLFVSMVLLMLALIGLVESVTSVKMDYSVANARVPCAVSVWFAIAGALVLTLTRASAGRRVRAIERGKAPPSLLRLGPVAYAKRATVVIWGECGIGAVMAFGHWVSGRMTGVDNPVDIVALLLLSFAAALLFSPKPSTWRRWFGMTTESEEETAGSVSVRLIREIETEPERDVRFEEILVGRDERPEDEPAGPASLEEEKAA